MAKYPITTRLREIASDLRAAARHDTPRSSDIEEQAAKLNEIIVELEQPAAGTSAYDMIAAAEQRNVETTETLIHMVAATVLAKLVDEEGGGRTNISFSPKDMDEMNQRYIQTATRDGMLTTVRIIPREGAFPNMDEHTAPAAGNVPSFYAEPGVDDTPAKPQAEEHSFDRPLWAARVGRKLYPASDRQQAERILALRHEDPDEVAMSIENRFCYHRECPAERCNRAADVAEVTSAD